MPGPSFIFWLPFCWVEYIVRWSREIKNNCLYQTKAVLPLRPRWKSSGPFCRRSRLRIDESLQDSSGLNMDSRLYEPFIRRQEPCRRRPARDHVFSDAWEPICKQLPGVCRPDYSVESTQISCRFRPQICRPFVCSPTLYRGTDQEQSRLTSNASLSLLRISTRRIYRSVETIFDVSTTGWCAVALAS